MQIPNRLTNLPKDRANVTLLQWTRIKVFPEASAVDILQDHGGFSLLDLEVLEFDDVGVVQFAVDCELVLGGSAEHLGKWYWYGFYGHELLAADVHGELYGAGGSFAQAGVATALVFHKAIHYF